MAAIDRSKVSGVLAAVGVPYSKIQPNVLALNTQFGGSQRYVIPAGWPDKAPEVAMLTLVIGSVIL